MHNGKVLFIFTGTYALEQQLDLARYFSTHSKIEPVFIVLRKEDFPLCNTISELNFELVNLSGTQPNFKSIKSSSVQSGPIKPSSRPISKFPNLIAFGKFLKSITLEHFILRKKVTRLKKQFRDLKPTAIVTSQDRLPDFLPAMRAIEALGFPLLLIPAHSICMPDGGAFMRLQRKQLELMVGLNKEIPMEKSLKFTALLNKLADWLLHDQIFESRFGRQLFSPAKELFTYKLAGILPPNLWQHGTRFSNFIILSGSDEERVCQAAGIPRRKIFTLGSPALDAVTNELIRNREVNRKNLFETYDLIPDKKLVILALPPLYEHDMKSEEEHLYWLREILKLSKMADANILISLHPKMAPTRYAWIIEEFGIKILQGTLKDALGSADIFVGAAYSATIRWAMAARIPCLNLDFWELNESTYADIAEYPTVKELQTYEQSLKKLIDSRTDKEETPIPMNLVADGKSSQRILDLIKSFH